MQHLKDFWKSPYMNFWFYMTLVCKNDQVFQWLISKIWCRYGLWMKYQKDELEQFHLAVHCVCVACLPVCVSPAPVLGEVGGPSEGEQSEVRTPSHSSDQLVYYNKLHMGGHTASHGHHGWRHTKGASFNYHPKVAFSIKHQTVINWQHVMCNELSGAISEVKRQWEAVRPSVRRHVRDTREVRDAECWRSGL